MRGAPPLSWSQGVALERLSSRTWRLDLDLEAGFEFKFVKDGHSWSQGGNFALGPQKTQFFYPYFEPRPGRVLVHPRSLAFWDERIKLRVYLPPSYEQNSSKYYPVMYCMDGQNLFEESSSVSPSGDEWGLDEAANRLIAAGDIEELILVGIDCRPQERFFDYGPWYEPEVNNGGGAHHFLGFLIHDAKREIENSYRVKADRQNTGLMGSSMGGLFSLYAARKFPLLFTKVACLSSSFWWSFEQMRKEVELSQLHDEQKIYLDSGTNEGDTDDHTLDMAKALREDGWTDGFDLQVMLFEGADHSEKAWSKRLAHPLRFLFPAP